MIKQWFADILRIDYVKQTAIGLAVIIVVGGGVYYYRTVLVHKEQAAHQAFEQCYAEFKKAAEKKSDEFLFEVGKVCELGYEQNKNTHTGPYFLALQADALAQEGKMDQAIEAMQEMIDQMSANSELYWMYKTKLGLFKLDSADEKVNQAGLEELENVAQTKENANKDIALYYLGLRAWSKNQLEKAKQWWQQVERIESKSQDQLSPWIKMAQEKLLAIAQDAKQQVV